MDWHPVYSDFDIGSSGRKVHYRYVDGYQEYSGG